MPPRPKRRGGAEAKEGEPGSAGPDPRWATRQALHAVAELLKGALASDDRGGTSSTTTATASSRQLLREVGELEDALVARGELAPGDAALVIDYEWGACARRDDGDGETDDALRRGLLRRCVEAERESRWLRQRLRRVDEMLADLETKVAARDAGGLD